LQEDLDETSTQRDERDIDNQMMMNQLAVHHCVEERFSVNSEFDPSGYQHHVMLSRLAIQPCFMQFNNFIDSLVCGENSIKGRYTMTKGARES
jgi:hypothetical protein